MEKSLSLTKIRYTFSIPYFKLTATSVAISLAEGEYHYFLALQENKLTIKYALRILYNYTVVASGQFALDKNAKSKQSIPALLLNNPLLLLLLLQPQELHPQSLLQLLQLLLQPHELLL